MVEKIKALLVKYEEIVVYLIVGVLNTIVSWLACFFAEFLLNEQAANEEEDEPHDIDDDAGYNPYMGCMDWDC